MLANSKSIRVDMFLSLFNIIRSQMLPLNLPQNIQQHKPTTPTLFSHCVLIFHSISISNSPSNLTNKEDKMFVYKMQLIELNVLNIFTGGCGQYNFSLPFAPSYSHNTDCFFCPHKPQLFIPAPSFYFTLVCLSHSCLCPVKFSSAVLVDFIERSSQFRLISFWPQHPRPVHSTCVCAFTCRLC